MKVKGKVLKQFFTSAKGVLIERDNMFVFIDCENGKSNILPKPREEQIPELPKAIIYSQVFNAVQTLDDETDYYLDITFNSVMFARETEEGKIIVELVITGERY